MKSPVKRKKGGTHRIVVVDDHPIVRHALCDLVAREKGLEICGEAANVTQALQKVEATDPDMVIVDVSLDGDDGLRLVQKIKSLYRNVKMLVISMHDETIFAPRAILAGAGGYLNKRDSITEMVNAIRIVLRGEIYLSPRMSSRLLQRSARGKPIDSDPTAILTNRELGVFVMIGQGHNTQHISQKLALSPKTIETHRRSIKTKLNLKSSLQLSRCAVLWVHENH